MSVADQITELLKVSAEIDQILVASNLNEVRAILNIEDGATADQTDVEIRDAYHSLVPRATTLELEELTDANPRHYTPSDLSKAITGLLGTSPYRSVAVNDTAEENDRVLLCSGTIDIDLQPAANFTGKFLHVKNTGSGVITVNADGVELIESSNSTNVPAGANLLLFSNGFKYFIM